MCNLTCDICNLLKIHTKTFFVFITTKLRHIEKSTEERMHERNLLGKKTDNSQSKGRLENRFTMVYCTNGLTIMDIRPPPKSAGLAHLLR